jgi:uncharacterized protein YndB with AHSA1/START domain
MKFDVVRQIGAVFREVGSREHEGQTARVVAATRSYDTTVEHVWDALTSAERLPGGFSPCRAICVLVAAISSRGTPAGRSRNVSRRARSW